MRRRPVRLVWLLAAVVMAVLLTAAPVGAITYGTFDANNTYSNVGALVVKSKVSGNYVSVCSGTLIAPTVFLTASHCTVALTSRGYTLDEVFVSFDNVINNNSTRIPVAEIVTNPDYNQRQSDSGDIGALILAEPASVKYPGIAPAALPTAGLLDQLAAQNGLKGQQFLAVGYGLQERVVGGGPPTFNDADERRFGYTTFNALNKGYIRLSQNPALGNSGTCFGDSGGPNFLAYQGQLVLVAVTVTGDAVCRATNVDYRTDTESARRFLATLPGVVLA